jgi:hypothetical protein
LPAQNDKLHFTFVQQSLQDTKGKRKLGCVKSLFAPVWHICKNCPFFTAANTAAANTAAKIWFKNAKY